MELSALGALGWMAVGVAAGLIAGIAVTYLILSRDAKLLRKQFESQAQTQANANEANVRLDELLRSMATGMSQLTEKAQAAELKRAEVEAQIKEQIKNMGEKNERLVLETANQVVTIYIHNGSFVQTSAALVVQAQKIIDGYTDSQGVKQPGYKPAGIPVTVQPATLQSQNVNIEVNTSPGYSLALVQTSIKSSVEQYFKDLDIRSEEHTSELQSH